jgi:hypothetical protein
MRQGSDGVSERWSRKDGSVRIRPDDKVIRRGVTRPRDAPHALSCTPPTRSPYGADLAQPAPSCPS